MSGRPTVYDDGQFHPTSALASVYLGTNRISGWHLNSTLLSLEAAEFVSDPAELCCFDDCDPARTRQSLSRRRQIRTQRLRGHL